MGKTFEAWFLPPQEKCLLGDMKYIPMEIIMCDQNTQGELKHFLAGERFC